MSNFDANAILRGAQMTLVGVHRALQNPQIFKQNHYRQAALAVAAGIAIRILIEIPVIMAHVALWFVSLFSDLDSARWDDDIMDGLRFLQHSVLQVPFFLMTLMRYLTPALDEMFMEALDWVDRTYIQKHASDDPDTLRAMYYPNLKLYTKPKTPNSKQKRPWGAILFLLARYGRRAGISLLIYLLSYIPVIGRFVLPAASFYTFNRAVGFQPAAAIFACGLLLPRRYLVVFLQTYFSSRSLMRELLVPYFSRIKFSKEQKRLWFRDREGVLFGFGAGFFLLIKVPLFGVLFYGLAEASAALLITKITDPPPPPAEEEAFIQSQIRWNNKHKFLSLKLANIDALNVSLKPDDKIPIEAGMPTKKFT